MARWIVRASPMVGLLGISDPEDPLELDVLMPGGPADYISWFQTLAQRRRAGGHAIPETA